MVNPNGRLKACQADSLLAQGRVQLKVGLTLTSARILRAVLLRNSGTLASVRS